MVEIRIKDLEGYPDRVKVCSKCFAFNHRDRKFCRNCKCTTFRECNSSDKDYLANIASREEPMEI